MTVWPSLGASAVLIAFLGLCAEPLAAQGRRPAPATGPMASLSQVLGRPTDRSVTLSLLSATAGDAYVEWKQASDTNPKRSTVVSMPPGQPVEIEIDGLKPDAQVRYRLFTKAAGQPTFEPGAEGGFHTQRAPGSPFTFALQGDSHPERQGKMFHPDLYARTLGNVAKDRPDFYLMLGDDFSIERLIERQTLSRESVGEVYAYQRGFLGLIGSSSPLFLVNGNHEQAARYLLDGTDTNAGVLAAQARNRFYALPAPSRFYTGDEEKVERVGFLRDYYAWTWGDALFVVIDPYWHSPVAVDNRAGERAHGDGKRKEGDNPKEGQGGKGKRDLWQITLGEAQYRWLTQTLTGSKARWKFVFAHHVNGTGRGGVEESDLYEWGGKDKRGRDQFQEKRPGWPMPIHALMVKTGVTVFFQGHDHIYAHQEREGVIYQSTPNPADSTYQAFNREAYRSGDILPNSGHLRVTVSPKDVRVDYVRAFLPSDEGDGRTNGMVAHSYSVKAKPAEGGR